MPTGGDTAADDDDDDDDVDHQDDDDASSSGDDSGSNDSGGTSYGTSSISAATSTEVASTTIVDASTTTSTETTGEAASTSSAADTTDGSGDPTGDFGNGICSGGSTYGTPLEGMGTIVEYGPPTSGEFPWFGFIEGPVWVESLGTLLFSDNVSPERIYALEPGGTTSLFLTDSGSNGLAVDEDDNLVVADQVRNRIVRLDSSSGAELGEMVAPGTYRPNDVVLRHDGNVYFTDPQSGFYWADPAGNVSTAYREVQAPNGILLSVDQSTLFVGDVGNRQVHRFPLLPDGAPDTANGDIFVTAMNDTVDGMAIDCAGNLYLGTGGGVEVYDADAAFIGLIPTGTSSNCAFGGPERRTLYVTSVSLLKSVELAIPGLPY